MRNSNRSKKLEAYDKVIQGQIAKIITEEVAETEASKKCQWLCSLILKGTSKQYFENYLKEHAKAVEKN